MNDVLALFFFGLFILLLLAFFIGYPICVILNQRRGRNLARQLRADLGLNRLTAESRSLREVWGGVHRGAPFALKVIPRSEIRYFCDSGRRRYRLRFFLRLVVPTGSAMPLPPPRLHRREDLLGYEWPRSLLTDTPFLLVTDLAATQVSAQVVRSALDQMMAMRVAPATPPPLPEFSPMEGAR